VTSIIAAFTTAFSRIGLTEAQLSEWKWPQDVRVQPSAVGPKALTDAGPGAEAMLDEEADAAGG
jgi:hypothetical protein